jgi:hypothetical protein
MTEPQIIGLLMPFFALLYAVVLAVTVKHFAAPRKHQGVGQAKPARH